MISIDRIGEIATSIALKNEALKQIRDSEEAMIAEQPDFVRDETKATSATLVLDEHKKNFYYLSDMLAELAAPFKRIRDLWAPESKIVLGDRYSYRYGGPNPDSWNRSMMFISHVDDRTYDSVILAEASAHRRESGLFRRNWTAEYSVSVGQIPRYLDEEYGFSFDGLERRVLKTSDDFEFVTTARDILFARGIAVPGIYVAFVPARVGILNVPWGSRIRPENIEEVEFSLAEVMAGSQAFRNQVVIGV